SLTLCRYPHTILFPYTTLFRSKLTMKLTTINKASNSLDNIRNVFINSKIESPITITPCRFINQYYLIYIYQNYLIYLENNKDTCQKILQQVPSDKTTCICASFIR